MRHKVIGFRLYRNIKRGYTFALPIYSYYKDIKCPIKEYATIDRYDPISEIDSEELSLVQFKYNKKTKRSKRSSRKRVNFTELISVYGDPSISIKDIMDRYKNDY